MIIILTHLFFWQPSLTTKLPARSFFFVCDRPSATKSLNPAYNIAVWLATRHSVGHAAKSAFCQQKKNK